MDLYKKGYFNLIAGVVCSISAIIQIYFYNDYEYYIILSILALINYIGFFILYFGDKQWKS